MILLDSKQYEVREINKIGKGVFAKVDLPPSKVIGDYVGKILSDEDEDDLPSLHGIERNKKETIWPLDITAIGLHLLNHSCTSNCTFMPYEGRMLGITKRKIFADEELTVEYFVEQGSLLDPEDPHTCMCKSVFCRGTLSTSTDYFQMFCDLYEKTDMQSKIVELGEILPPLLVYPGFLPVPEFFNIFGNFEAVPVEMSNLKDLSISDLRQLIKESGTSIYFSDSGIKVLGVFFNRSLLCSK